MVSGGKLGAHSTKTSRAGERPSEVPDARINLCWIPTVISDLLSTYADVFAIKVVEKLSGPFHSLIVMNH
jgi:hypothetical protein